MAQPGSCNDRLSVRLRDGRRLTYQTLGQPDGFPVLYMHGAIGSPHWHTPELEAAVVAHGVRYVAAWRYHVPTAGFCVPLAGPLFYDAALRLLDARAATAPRNMVDDYLVCRRPWGFEPCDVSVPVVLWHGLRDRLVPVGHALRLAAALPACATRLEPGAGHFFFGRRATEIIGSVLSRV
jgi:pimeloyl-ACP methyl ester carboxylesterase